MSDSNKEDAELYARLFPFIASDFVFKEDLRNTLLLLNPESEILNFINISSQPEALKRAMLYKHLLDKGDDDLSKTINPIIEI